MDDVEAATPEELLGHLEQRNAERVNALIEKGIRPQPGMFEQIRTLVYLEHLLGEMGILTRAQLDVANKMSELIGQMEGQVAKATLLAPMEHPPMNGPIPINRQQRRHPDGG